MNVELDRGSIGALIDLLDDAVDHLDDEEDKETIGMYHTIRDTLQVKFSGG